MNHKDFLVDILDFQGNKISQKPRGEVNKQKDIYHTIFGLLKTPDGDFILCEIPERSDMPNLYSDLYGAPMATIKRTGETPLQAAKRGFSTELYIEPQIKLIGEGMLELPVNRRTYATVFLAESSVPKNFSRTDVGKITTFTPKQLDKTLGNGKFAPTLIEIWRTYRAKL